MKFLAKLWTAVTVLLVVLYLASCLTPFISPVSLWPMAYLNLAFPYLLVLLVIVMLVWLAINRKMATLLIIVTAVGWYNISRTLAINFTNNASTARPAGALRIMGWNVRNFDNPADHADSFNSVRNRMFRHIQAVDPDVLCLQEMVEYIGPSFLSNIEKLQSLGYRYYYKPAEIEDHHNWGITRSSNAIFSKYPLIDSGNVVLNDTTHPRKIIYADILFNGKPVRLFSTHYRSFYLSSVPATPPVAFHGDTGLINRTGNVEKLKVFEQEHAKEAVIVKKFVEESPHPVVLVADMNTVPVSYAYRKTAGNLQDAFLKKGYGLGGTLDSLPITLRIDYLLADPAFYIVNYRQHKLSLSDHYPHFMDIHWKR